MSKYFYPAEMKCRCSRPACNARQECVPDLLARLDLVRDLYGKPMRVVSGLRCPTWNVLSKGTANSEHLTGEAADIVCETSQDRHELLIAGLRAFHRIGIGRLFLHFGCASNLPPHVVWLYGTP